MGAAAAAAPASEPAGVGVGGDRAIAKFRRRARCQISKVVDGAPHYQRNYSDSDTRSPATMPNTWPGQPRPFCASCCMLAHQFLTLGPLEQMHATIIQVSASSEDRGLLLSPRIAFGDICCIADMKFFCPRARVATSGKFRCASRPARAARLLPQPRRFGQMAAPSRARDSRTRDVCWK